MSLKKQIRSQCFALLFFINAGSMMVAQTQHLNAEVSPFVEQNEAVQETMDWQRAEQGWISLFDGQTIFGWRRVAPGDISDSKLVVSSLNSPVRTSSQFRNYRLRIEYEIIDNAAAKILLRTSPDGKSDLVDHIALDLTPLGDDEEDSDGLRAMTIDVNERQLSWQLGEKNASMVVPVTAPNLGYLGFQVSRGQLKINRLELLPLGGESLMVDNNRANWNSELLGSATAKWIDGALQLQGGPGQLESSRSYGDFVLQVKAKASAATNSGVFFRCIPGQKSNGYESQIQNEFLDEDRSKPKDCGTGGIFRRVDARKVVAEPDQWFVKTVVACGGQISVWVNGYQVTDWSDQRRPHENPRKGRRVEPGTLILQAHDPACKIQFQSIWIQELGSRK